MIPALKNLSTLVLFVIAILYAEYNWAQKDNNTYAHCEGTINIFKSNTFDLQFLGEKSASDKFKEFPALQHIQSANQIWFSFLAPANGNVSIEAETEGTNSLRLLVFDALSGNVCKDVNDGNAEILRVVSPKNAKKIGLSEDVSENFLYPVSMEEGKTLQFVLITDSSALDLVKLNVKFNAEDEDFSEHLPKEVSFRENLELPLLNIKIRDKESGHPIVTDLVIKGMNKYDGIYTVSDLSFDIARRARIYLTCILEGYFPIEEMEVYYPSDKDCNILLELEKIQSGKMIQLSNVDFVPGTSEITEKSFPKLRQIKDFLALNASIHVEIQGHVFEPGEKNSTAGQAMSEARAKRIMKYLIDNGIRKERLTAVGYGNSRPLIRYPKSVSEEQANRRVEIMVK